MDAVRSAREWIQARLDDGTFDAVFAFPQGGCSISENEPHEQLMEQLLDYPLSPLSEFNVQPLVGIDAAFDCFILRVPDFSPV